MRSLTIRLFILLGLLFPALASAEPSLLLANLSSPSADATSNHALPETLRASAIPATTEPAPAEKARIQSAYGKLPLYFIQNDGQVDKKVRYYEKGAGHSTFFAEDGVYLNLVKAKPGKDTKDNSAKPDSAKDAKQYQAETVKLSLVKSNPHPRIVAEEKQASKINYFTGNNKSQWKTDISTYLAVRYEEAYKGVDVRYYGNNSQIEYDVIVKPGADPKQVKFQYRGIKGLKVTEAGELDIRLKEGNIVQKKPVIYQEIDGKRVEVDGQFKVLTKKNGKFSYGFQVASYDITRELVIDPTLVYSTYLGGAGTDYGNGIAVDAAGNAYVMGTTTSIDFPFTAGTMVGSNGVYVTKLNPSGTALVYSTYLGGGQGSGIAVDSSGYAYVTGYTSSINFPVTAGATQTVFGGTRDAFVTKLNPTGTALAYSTYLGGGSGDQGLAIAVDSSGYAYVTGYTSSINFPVTAGAAQGVSGGGDEAFVTLLNPSGTAWVYSTYLGGTSGGDYGYGIAIDSVGNAYVTGATTSSNFPVTANALRSQFGGGYWDSFLTKINANGSAISYSTYLGGTGNDLSRGIALDNNGDIYLTGGTTSPDFPLLNPLQPQLNARGDCFVTKVDGASFSIIYSTFFGGSWGDSCNAIAVDNTGHAYIVGYSEVDGSITLVNPVLSSQAGQAAFAAKFDISGSALIYSTYVGAVNYNPATGGGPHLNSATSIAVDNAGDAYIAGYTNDLIWTSANAVQSTFAGGIEAFVVKLASNVSPVLTYSAELGYGTVGVSPVTGNAATSLTYKAVYVDADNTAPAPIDVCIDAAPCAAMALDGGAAAALHDGNYANGEQYLFTTSLAVGAHTYFFTASDGTASINLPASGSLSGPTISNLNISTTTLPDGTVGAAYSHQTLVVTGGTAPYTFSVTSLPAGLTLDISTGVISGTPTTTGLTGFSVSVTDAAGAVFTNAFSMNVVEGVNTAPFFGIGDGKVTTDMGGDNTGESVAVQADGKILVAGFGSGNFALVRYNTDGSLDDSFGTSGKVTTDFGGSDGGYSVTVQADGKILVAGVSNGKFALARYNTDGSLDTAFDGDGKVTTAIGVSAEGHSISLQADGKILVAGSSDGDFALARYNIDGSLDTSFDTDGKVTTDFDAGGDGHNDTGRSVIIQPDGRILVAGSNGSNTHFGLARYITDGSLDTSFGTGGKVTTTYDSLGYWYFTASSITLQTDGKILASGNFYGPAYYGRVDSSGNFDFALLRYNADGSLDTTFDGDGKVLTDLGGDNFGNSVIVQPDGKILVVGGGGFSLARYNTNGSLDTSFDGDGKVTTNIGLTAQGYSGTLQSDGKILVAGGSWNNFNGVGGSFALARYNTDGSLDTRFHLSSTLNGIPSFTQGGTAVVLDSNVQIVDVELAAISNYGGTSLTLSRNGGANAQDVFSNTGTLGVLIQGGSLTVGGTTIGTVTTNSGGTLTLTFNSSATQSLVNSAMQQIAYSNSATTPPASVQINWTFSDGNSGAQGSGGALSITGNTMVSITAAATSQTIGTISFSPTALAVGGTTTASATATSGLAVSFSSTTPSVCTVSGNTITGVSAGTCTIAANQAGNATYSAATQVTQAINVAAPVPSVSWTTMAPMPTAVYGAAVGEISGTLYVAGGANAAGPSDALQAYNPATNAWSALAPMPGGRYQGDGAAVINGQLYVVGGWTWSPPLPNSNLWVYNPLTNTWSALSSMPILSGCGASGTINGKLYVTTACDGYSGYRNFLHVYDPATNAWSALASSADAHAGSAAGVINGKLYVAGGVDGAGIATNMLEVYDPATNVWSTLAAMPAARSNMTGAVVNGKLYAIGGSDAMGAVVATVEVYDPVMNTWTSESPIITARATAAAGVVNGVIYAVGGADATGALAVNEAVNVSTVRASWATKALLPTAVYGAAVGEISGTLYVAGGANAAGPSDALQAYNPATNAWSAFAPMPGGRYQGDGAAVINGQLYVVGGWTWSPPLPNSDLWVYNPLTNTWSALASMPILSGCGASGAINGKLYVITACDGYSGYRNFLHVYDPATNAWSALASSTNAHAGPAAGVINGKLYVAGGVDGAGIATNMLEVYDPATNVWSTLAAMPAARSNMTGAVVNGKLYAIGGSDATGAVVATVEVYDPVTNTWASTSSMLTARQLAAAGVVNGVVYAVGGADATGALAVNEALVVSTGTAPTATVLTMPGGETAEVTEPVGETFIVPPTVSATVPTVSGVSFPNGTIDYTVTAPLGGSVTTTFKFTPTLAPTTVLYKMAANGTATLIPASSWTRTDTATTTTIVLTLQDGGPFDLDGAANRVIVDPLAVGVVNNVDLVPSALSTTTTSVNIGTSLVVNNTVTNQGTTATTVTSTVGYYLSTDATITTADKLIGSRTVGSLAAGATSSASSTLTIPATFTPGVYYLGMLVDTANTQPENNETNNTLVATGMVTVVRDVDLVPTSIIPSVTSVNIGTSLTVDNTVANQGSTVTSASSTVSYYLSTDATITTADKLIGSRTISNLAAGASSAASPAITIPASFTPGEYYLGMLVDTANTQPENNETNNTLVATGMVTVVRDVDLVPTSIIPSVTSVNIGTSLTVDNTVANQGSTVTSASSTVSYYLSTDATITTADKLIGSRTISNLAAGASSAASPAITIPASFTPGVYYLGMLVDTANTQPENNETNNTLVATGTVTVVRDVDLVMSAVSTGATSVNIGTSFTIDNTETNQGSTVMSVTSNTVRFYLSTDATITSADTLLTGTLIVSTLADGASSAAATEVTVPTSVAPGTYYVGACADATSVQPETNETNNCLAGGTITVVRDVDLVMSAVSTGATSVNIGTSFTIDNTETNQGSTVMSVTSNTVRFYLSTDATITSADTLLTGTRSVSTLAAGASSAASTTVTVPTSVAPGTYYIGAIADANSAQPETTETNNVLAGGTITVVRDVDLVMSAVSTGATSVNIGTSFTIDNTETNQGSTVMSVTTNTVRFYLSSDATITSADTLLTGTRSVSTLAAGASSAASTTVTVPTSVAPGTYYIGAIADANSAQPETTETNNVLAGGTITVVRDVDLVPTSLSTTATSVNIGSSLTVDNTVANQGATVTSASSFTVSYYLSTDATITAADKLIGSRSVYGLAAGASSTASSTLTIPANTALRTYYLGVLVDSANAQPENNETNNTRVASGMVTVTSGVDLVVSALGPLPVGVVTGTSQLLSDTITNMGVTATTSATGFTVKYYLSADNVITTADRLIGSRAIASLAAGGTDIGSPTVTIPSTLTTGTYYLGAIADANANQPEYDETNNSFLGAQVVVCSPTQICVQ